jgi:single-stranded DNA-binding protein
MSYASLIVAMTDQPTQQSFDGKELICAHATVQGSQPIHIAVQAIPGTAPGDALLAKKQDDLLIVSGAVSLIDDGNTPLVTASVICDAHPDQYLNEVVIVGRLSGETRLAGSGKSACRSIAVNRYRKKSDDAEPVEETDWYPIRGFGHNRDKLERVAKGSLVQVAGIFNQMTNAKDEPYCEIRARNIRVHRSGGSGGNPAAGTKAAGYDHESFMGSADSIGTNSDWT